MNKYGLVYLDQRKHLSGPRFAWLATAATALASMIIVGGCVALYWLSLIWDRWGK